MTDLFIRMAIKAQARELPEDIRERCRAVAKAEHLGLQAQLDLLTDAAIKLHEAGRRESVG